MEAEIEYEAPGDIIRLIPENYEEADTLRRLTSNKNQTTLTEQNEAHNVRSTFILRKEPDICLNTHKP